MPEITFILVRPEYAGNIGSAARAIANFGFTKLAVVAPRQSPTHREAQKFAMKAQPLPATALVTRTLAEATADLHFVIGTSRRFGKFRRDFLPTRAIGQLLDGLGKRQQVGILFGSEIKGLTNDELAACYRVLTIPTHIQCPSMNLAHAVTIVAYETAQALHALTTPISVRRVPPLAAQELIDGMFGKWETALHAIGFFKHGSAKKVLRDTRHLFGRTTLSEHEAQMLWAMWQKVLWQLEK